MAKCLNCPVEVVQKGNKPRLYCSDKCKTAFHRKGSIVTESNRNNYIVTEPKGRFWIGDKTFKTRQESDAEFTRLMAQDDRSQPNKRVSKPGDADYPAQTGTKKCWCCGEPLEYDVLVCCGPCAWSGRAKRAREAGWGPGNPCVVVGEGMCAHEVAERARRVRETVGAER